MADIKKKIPYMNSIILVLTLSIQGAFAQVRHGSTTEEVMAKGVYDWGYLDQNNVGLCGLPMETREDNNSLVSHHLIVETVLDHTKEPTERIYLKSADLFSTNNCDLHKQKILEFLRKQGGQIPVTLYFTDKLMINRGSYMGMSFCRKEKNRTIEATINKVPYLRTTIISEESCK